MKRVAGNNVNIFREVSLESRFLWGFDRGLAGDHCSHLGG
jgi:hypothetical protein